MMNTDLLDEEGIEVENYTETTASFGSDPNDPGPLVRLLESAPPGSFVQVGKRVEHGVTTLTASRQIPGRGSVHATPLTLISTDGGPIPYETGVALLLAELEARERIEREKIEALAS